MESQCSIFALLFAANPVGRYLARYIPRATGKLAKGEIGTWKRSHHDPNLSSTAKSHYAAKLPARSAVLCRAKYKSKHCGGS